MLHKPISKPTNPPRFSNLFSPKHFIHEHDGTGIKWKDAILRGYNLVKPLREQHRWSGGDYANPTYSLFHFAHIMLAERAMGKAAQLISLTSIDAQATHSLLSMRLPAFCWNTK